MDDGVLCCSLLASGAREACLLDLRGRPVRVCQIEFFFFFFFFFRRTKRRLPGLSGAGG
jgi:hypothetical protein